VPLPQINMTDQATWPSSPVMIPTPSMDPRQPQNMVFTGLTKMEETALRIFANLLKDAGSIEGYACCAWRAAEIFWANQPHPEPSSER
jgi:hypothetical protein